MKNGYKLSLAAIAASISLVGCGSDSTTAETVTGQFVDTYVSGLNYACSSGATGITDDMGYYTCNVGDTVEFSLGGYVLGTATASEGIVTPETLYPENPEAALNVAQVIQSLDTDPTDDIITIPENFSDLDDVTVTPEAANFDALIEDELSVPLITEEEAQDHLDETELMLLLGGKTFYNVGDDWIDRVVFNADLTSVTWSQVIGGRDTGTDSLQLDGDQLIVTSGEDGSVFRVEIAEETTDYLLLDLLDESGTVFEQSRFYFDQAEAEASFEGWILITEEKLSAETFYGVETEYDDWNNSTSPTGYLYSTMTFSNGTLTRKELWVNATNPDDTESWNFTLPYELIDGKIRVDASDVPDPDPEDQEGYIWFTLISESSDQWYLSKEDDANKDGIIDADSSGTATWLLSEPADFPASL